MFLSVFIVVFWAKFPTSVNFLLEVDFHGCVTPFSDILDKNHLPYHPKYPKKYEKSVSFQPFQAKSKFVLEHSEIWTRVKAKTKSSEQCGIVRFRTTSGYTLKTTIKRATLYILVKKTVRAETFSGESRLPTSFFPGYGLLKKLQTKFILLSEKMHF